ncbi:MAG: diguanylate cyclase [Pseudomonadaceae bacterium]|nr:MAG: diguanylate cyclase [Pseudomonadaceae bacterium]
MSFNQQLAALQQQYVQGLPDTMKMLQNFAEPLSAPGWTEQTVRPLAELLHKLAGSAGTFGLTELSAQAARLEHRLDALLGEPLVEEQQAKSLQLKADLDALSQYEVPAVLPVSVSGSLTPEKAAPSSLVSEVWLLEDDEIQGSSLIAQFQAFNFNTRLFTRFNDLLEAFLLSQPEVLVLDIMLGSEGRSVDCLQNADLTFEGKSRLIFVSAKDDFNARLQAASLGAEGYFVKPLDVPKLITRIEQVLARLHAPAERVLIVDDDELLAQYYQQLLLAAGMQVEILHQPDQIIEYLEQKRPDIILMDLQMPGVNGQNLAAVVRQYDQWVGLPIVYLSAENDPQMQLKALNQGADDFLTKPIDDAHLVTVVRSKVIRSRQLLELMTKDSLTGLLKHATIKEAVSREWGIARRKGETFCVAMLDLDHFKLVNDTYGHAAGDEVIAAVATLLRQRLRSTDVLGRYGGEEFAVVMANCDAAAASLVLDDFRQQFQALEFLAEQTKFNVTISIGVAEYKPDMDIDAEALLVCADKALYEAKSAGRNRLVVFGA